MAESPTWREGWRIFYWQLIYFKKRLSSYKSLSSSSSSSSSPTMGKLIELARREKDWSQERLGQAISVSRDTIWRWETSRLSPTIESLQKIAEATGKPISYFLDMDIEVKIEGDLTGKEKLFSSLGTSLASSVAEPKASYSSTKTIRIPLLGECPAGDISFIADDVEDWVEISWNFIKDKDCFALRIKGDCLKDTGIFDKDIIIVSKEQQIKNGDIVVVRLDQDECTCKKIYFKGNQIILQPANDDHEPIVVKKGSKEIEIIGKVIRALKTF